VIETKFFLWNIIACTVRTSTGPSFNLQPIQILIESPLFYWIQRPPLLSGVVLRAHSFWLTLSCSLSVVVVVLSLRWWRWTVEVKHWRKSCSKNLIYVKSVHYFVTIRFLWLFKKPFIDGIVCVFLFVVWNK